MNNQTLKIIDKHLQRLIDLEINFVPVAVDPEMTDPNIVSTDDWSPWLPIISTINNKDISKIEKTIGIQLPLSYRSFLQHKHFYKLRVGGCNFPPHPFRDWDKHLIAFILESFPEKNASNSPFIPFADWEDWGLLCFDTRNPAPDNEYPIVLWDHEVEDAFKPVYDDFESMLYELDNELE